MTKINDNQFIIKNGMEGLGVFAAKNIKKNVMLFELTGDTVTKATRTSIQIGDHTHVENELGALLNHACKANAKVDKNKRALVSICDIKKGEEITFNYNENEDVLSSPFVCGCCGKVIQGKSRTTADGVS